MNTLTAEIDVTCAPNDDLGVKWHTHNEVWSRLEKKFNDFYGTDYKFNYQL